MCHRHFTPYSNCTRRSGTYTFEPCDQPRLEPVRLDFQYTPCLDFVNTVGLQSIPSYACKKKPGRGCLNPTGKPDCNWDGLIEKLRAVAMDRRDVERGVRREGVGWSLPGVMKGRG
jgi:hypothetical protein